MTCHPVRFTLALLPAVLVLSCGARVYGASEAPPALLVDAIERAVLERMGGMVSVVVDLVSADVESGRSLQAVPDPAARVGQPARFTLTAGGVRRGTAVATVQVHAQYARAARAIARDEIVTEAAIDVVHAELPGVAFRRVPAAREVVGLRARRAIAPGEPLTDAVLDVPPAVRSGEEVTVTVTLGRVQVTGTAIASGSGHPGDIIRVLSPRTRKPLKVRIIGRGAVEVLP
ncbi:MAG: flagellar basal body P-ring formation protein FlgA [Acidobacteria bacterium]|nr:flagellar basal body P-ring formation protein FlgA [Acidobacteriota bacterium]